MSLMVWTACRYQVGVLESLKILYLIGDDEVVDVPIGWSTVFALKAMV